MVGQRAAGNGNFDIDAIRMAANAMENPSAVIDQPLVDPVADAFAADVDDMVDELRFNPSSNLTEEAQQIMNSPLAARLGAGVMADLRAAVQLQEEKAANGADAFMRGDAVWEEQKEKREKERAEQAKIADMADDAQNASQSMTPQQWDEAPSSEYPGMTNAEALAAIKRINANLPFYSQLAVQRGLIKEEERPEFERLMLAKQRMMEAEREGRKPDPADVQAWKDAPPHLRKATADTIQFANARGLDDELAAPIAGAQANAVGANAAFDAGTNALTVDDGAKPPVEAAPVSVAKSLDQEEGSATDQPSITAVFNTSANGTVATQSPIATPVAPVQPVRVASANFDQSAGMI